MRHSEKIIPIRDQIADQLRSDIISGELAPGTKLNEQALATRIRRFEGTDSRRLAAVVDGRAAGHQKQRWCLGQ